MKYARSDRSAIRFNDNIKFSAIPDDAHTVRLGQLTLVDWVLDRCQLVKDPSSGRTIFDPNDISRRHGCPRLIAEFLATTIAASCDAAHRWTGAIESTDQSTLIMYLDLYKKIVKSPQETSPSSVD